MPITCPNCQSIATKRVKTLVEGELANTPIARKLAMPIQPYPPTQPPRPERAVGWKPSNMRLFEGDGDQTGAAKIAGAFFFMCVLPGLFFNQTGFIIGFVLFLVLLAIDFGLLDGLWIAIAYPQAARETAQQEYQNKLVYYQEQTFPHWQATVQKWEQLYRCGDCGRIFTPGQDKSVEAEQVDQLLY